MTRKTIAIVIALGAGAACYHGTRVESLATPTQPNGAQLILKLNSGTFSGELLAVEEESGLVLISGSRIVLVPFQAVRRGHFPEFAKAVSLGPGVPAPDVVRKVRLLSHFPGGLSPLIKGKLLAAYHQTDWVRVQ